MKRIQFLLVSLFILTNISLGQNKTTKAANIRFDSDLGGIYAESEDVFSELNTSTGALVFKLKIESFTFKNSLMQKHYNEEDMMNSEKFPDAIFKGSISNNTSVNYKKDGVYPVSVKGKLTIKGVSKSFTTKGSITIKNGQITAKSIFNLDRHNFNVIGNEESVSQVLKLTVKASY